MALSCLLAVVTGACVYLPPAPLVVPTRVRDTRFSLGTGAVFMPSEVEATTTETGPVRDVDNWDGENGPMPALFDPRVGVGRAESESLAWDVDVSMLTAGLQVHYIPNGLSAQAPLAFTLGAAGDGPMVWPTDRLVGFGWEVRAGATWHPRLAPEVEAVLGGGASFGGRRHHLDTPRSLVRRDEMDNIDTPEDSEIQLVRAELRAEAVVGITFPLGSSLRATLALQPFYVPYAGRPRSNCEFCRAPNALTSYEANWGLAYQLTFRGR